MKLSKWKQKKLARTINQMFGEDIPWSRSGEYCFVHVDRADDVIQEARVANFVATDFFDPECPHCRPFLDDGAFMVFDGDDVIGVRMKSKGMVESVMFRSPAPQAVAN